MSRFYAQSRFIHCSKSNLRRSHTSAFSVSSGLLRSLSSQTHLLRLSFFSSGNLSGGIGRSSYGISRFRPFHRLQAPTIRSFSSCSASQDLTMMKCVPCKSIDIQPMSEQTANELLKQVLSSPFVMSKLRFNMVFFKVQGWELLNEDGTMKLQRSWKVKSFTKGLNFFRLVADIAEAEGHHPDLHLVGWNNVKIEIWTHSVGGLTENDFILAAKISSLKAEDLLRNKTAAQSD